MRNLLRNTLAAALLLACAGCAHRGESPPPAPSTVPPRKNTPAPVPAPEDTREVQVGTDMFVACYPPDVPMSDAADNPKFGDYVYVEELPEATEKVPPVYPESARGRDGDRLVLVQALVRRDGTVGEVCIVRSIPALDRAAATCVEHWRFRPAKTAGNPVAVWVGVPVKFEAP
jgi:protein TonB